MELKIGKYIIHQGDQNPCEYPEKLWLFNEGGEGMEIRTENLESVLDKFFKENF